MTTQIVFIALQANEEMRPVIDAIEADNPHATVNRYPAMVKIDAPGRWRSTAPAWKSAWAALGTCRNCSLA